MTTRRRGVSEPLKPIGFWSYTRDDDTLSRGRLSQLRTLLAEALQGKVGRAERVRIFQDATTIAYGARWERQIDAALNECSFFIPIVTPGFLQSEWCCKELLRFCAREASLGRDDLIFPIIYDDVDDVDPDRRGDIHDRAAWECLQQRQRVDFRALRFEALDSKAARLQLDDLARAIRAALRREVEPPVPASPEPPPAPSAETASLVQVAAERQRMPTADPAGADAGAADHAPTTAATSAANAPASPLPSFADRRARSRGLKVPLGAAAVLLVVLAGYAGQQVYWGRVSGATHRLQPAAAPTKAVVSPAAEPRAAQPAQPASPAARTAAPTAEPAQPRQSEQATTTAGNSVQGTVMRDCPTCPEMVLIPAGNFMMGVPPEEDDRDGMPRIINDNARPVHRVVVADAFWLGAYPITRAEYAAFVRDADYIAGGSAWREDQNDRDPVVDVSLEDAKAYAAWLSHKTGKRYRLPSEAEWEYAARAGTTTARFWGDDFKHDAACRYANVADEALRKQRHDADKAFYFACDDGYANASPVGSFLPNAFRLYDMLGNVWQWTANCYESSYAGASDDASVVLAGDCSLGVLRGGSWYNGPRFVRAGGRDSEGRRFHFAWVGFRVARTQ